MKKNNRRNPAWKEPGQRSRGPKPGLSNAGIAQAAIRIADVEGLQAVTMQRVARECGVTTMALYRYFPGKPDLIATMIDLAGESNPGFATSSATWKERLIEWTRRCGAIYQRHPWFLEATTTRSSAMGPNELSWMEAALGLLAEAGLPPKDCYYTFLAIIGHIRGYATFEGFRKSSRSRRQSIRNLIPSERLGSHEYPVLEAVLGSDAFSEGATQAFEYGINCILNGVSAAKRKPGAQTRIVDHRVR